MRQGKMIIMGKKVSLRKLTEADTENIVRWRNSPSVRANFVYRADFTAEGHMKWFTDVIGAGIRAYVDALNKICYEENN